jgi:tRNA nucleotidyltransferase (CCA-adding enzyme)
MDERERAQPAGDSDAESAMVLRGLADLPGGLDLLALAETRADVELVGGAVRDLLLGADPCELDVVTADAPALARELAARLGGEVTLHERFGTALVEYGEVRIDVATRRAESYPAPGALPEVRPGTPEEDLARRDFTVNAIAVGLGGARRGKLRHVPFALEDLRAGRLRVLHERSFLDDPTRLLRLARYSARLDFTTVEEHTAELAREAVSGGALRTVSGARAGAELRLALAESLPFKALIAMDELGMLEALHPDLWLNAPLMYEAQRLLPEDGRLDRLLLIVLVAVLLLCAEKRPEDQARELLDRLEFPRGERDRVVAAAVGAIHLRAAMPLCESAAELYVAAHGEPPEGVALAAVLDGDRDGHEEAVECATFWLEQLRHKELRITGEDLLAAGVPEGPEVGNRLTATLLLYVNGQVGDDGEEQLRVALALPAEVARNGPPRPHPRPPRRRRRGHG